MYKIIAVFRSLITSVKRMYHLEDKVNCEKIFIYHKIHLWYRAQSLCKFSNLKDDIDLSEYFNRLLLLLNIYTTYSWKFLLDYHMDT